MIRQLPCDLSVKEVAERRVRLVTTLGEIDTQTAHFKELKADQKAVINDLSQTQGELLKQIREGQEIRAVECEERKVFETNVKQIVRLDTKAVVDERALTVQERQSELDLDGEDDDADSD